MKYWTRIQLAALVSLALNLALVSILPHMIRDDVVMARADRERPAVRLNFQQPEPPSPAEPVQRLVDSGAPAEEPVQDTDLISDQASQAQDTADTDGDAARPAVEETDEFDELGTPPIPPPRPPQPPAPQAVAREPVERAPDGGAVEDADSGEAAQTEANVEPLPEPERVARAPEVTVPRELRKRDEAPAEEADAQGTDVAEKADEGEQFEVAQATPPIPVQEMRSTRGRPDGGVLKSGFTSFEANKHALGEYMLGVRNRVEREWRTALQLRYSGVTRTYAIIECSIRPDGTLEYAKIIEAGSSLTYAVLCRQAIEQAAPYGPFPFDVPEIYRTKNLQITWKFSYL